MPKLTIEQIREFDETGGLSPAGRLMRWTPGGGYTDTEFSVGDLGATAAALAAVAEAAAAILRPARGDAPWLHTAEFDDLRSALAAAGVPIENGLLGPDRAT